MLLLDTHVLLWWLADSSQLSRSTAESIERAERVSISAASIWEIEIKRAKGKLITPDNLTQQIDASAFDLLAITGEHAEEAARLPPLHSDPFDRMLVGQARIEGLTLVTSDELIRRYEVSTLAAAGQLRG